MELLVKETAEGYVAVKFERMYEEKVASFLKENGIELIEILKFGHDEDDPECELKYDVHVKSISRDKDDLMEQGLALVYADTEDDSDIYTVSFFWYKDDEESMEYFYERLSSVYGLEPSTELHDDTMERLKRGIDWGELEVISA